MKSQIGYLVFSIKNQNNGKQYFGICREDKYHAVRNRHYILLEKDLHPNKHLQYSFNFYGQDVFLFGIEFRLWEYERAEKLRTRCIERFNTTSGEWGYNHNGVDLLNG